MGKTAGSNRLSSETKGNIIEAVRSGAMQSDVARRFGVSQATVSRIVRKANGRANGKVRVVLSDEHGELSFDEVTNQYLGTVNLPDGTKAGERFANQRHLHERDVVAKYRRWRSNKLDEHQFMCMVERRDANVPPAKEEPSTKDEVAEERADEVVVREDAPIVADVPDTIYVVFLKGVNAKPVGWYRTMDGAVDAADNMNVALKMAGYDELYDVCECGRMGD